MTSDQAVRDHVLALLDGREAHMTLEDATANFPVDLLNVQPPNVPYTCWHLLEHIRIAQWDILEYTRNPAHVSPPWPEGHWPPPEAQADQAKWQETIHRINSDLAAMKAIVADPATDLFAPIAHGYGGHTVLREALLLADHNAYHIGELGILRQVLNAW